MNEEEDITIPNLLNSAFGCLSRMSNKKSCLIHSKADKSCKECTHVCGTTKLDSLLRTIEIKATSKDPDASVAYPRFEKNIHNQFEYIR